MIIFSCSIIRDKICSVYKYSVGFYVAELLNSWAKSKYCNEWLYELSFLSLFFLPCASLIYPLIVFLSYFDLGFWSHCVDQHDTTILSRAEMPSLPNKLWLSHIAKYSIILFCFISLLYTTYSLFIIHYSLFIFISNVEMITCIYTTY